MERKIYVRCDLRHKGIKKRSLSVLEVETRFAICHYQILISFRIQKVLMLFHLTDRKAHPSERLSED